MEREPGDPGVPYDPDAPERLQPRSASNRPVPPPPAVPPPYGGPGVSRRPDRRRGGRSWGAGGLATIGLIAVFAFAGHNDDGDDDGDRMQVVSVGPEVTSIRVDATTDDVRLEHQNGTAREVLVHGDSATSRVEGGTLVVRPRSDTRLTLPGGIPVVVRTSTGDVEGSGLTVGDLEVETNTGDVDLGFASVPTSVDVRTTTGDADLELPESGAYAVDVSTNTGDPNVAHNDPGAPNKVTVRTNTGDIDVEN
jgi:hypothetical protein